MAKSPKTPKSKQKPSLKSTRKPALLFKSKPKRAGAPGACKCCPDCTGKPYGTMGMCEDGGCVDIAPPQGVGPWVLYWNTTLNGNVPYWEAVVNL